MNYWIFKVNDDEVDNERIKGIEVYTQRMKDRFWGLHENAKNLSYLQVDDKIVFYLAGNEGHIFLGTATLASNYHTLTEKEKTELWHGKFFRPEHGVRLKQVKVWIRSKPIQPLVEIQALSFIKSKENWGAYLQGSVQQVSLKDYNRIVERNDDKETKEQSPNVVTGTLRVIEDKTGIDKAQSIFESKLGSAADRSETIWVGYPGGHEKAEASWNKKLGVWWVNSTSDDNRYWNVFGIGEPQWGSNHSHDITCEINPPFKGINRSMAGVFAIDCDDKVYLLHRGKIGGGKPGNSKTKFEKEYRGCWIYAQDGDRLTKLALIASFESPRFMEQVADFIYQVSSIKSGQQNDNTLHTVDANLQNQGFSNEYEGKKIYNISQRVEAACDHGIIANTLAATLKAKGVKVGSNHQIDLFTMANGDVTTLFEIKTDSSTTNIYGAIGQLLYHSTNIDKPCKLITVFPKDIDNQSKAILERLNINCITYSWDNGRPLFDIPQGLNLM